MAGKDQTCKMEKQPFDVPVKNFVSVRPCQELALLAGPFFTRKQSHKTAIFSREID
jgi:hypothetical protein